MWRWDQQKVETGQREGSMKQNRANFASLLFYLCKIVLGLKIVSLFTLKYHSYLIFNLIFLSCFSDLWIYMKSILMVENLNYMQSTIKLATWRREERDFTETKNINPFLLELNIEGKKQENAAQMITFISTQCCAAACQNKETHPIQRCKSFSSNLWLQRKQHQFATFQLSELVFGVFYVCCVKRRNWCRGSLFLSIKLPLELIKDLEDWTDGENLEGGSHQPRSCNK